MSSEESLLKHGFKRVDNVGLVKEDDIFSLVKDAYISYGQYINIDGARSIPGIDGLKNSYRRIFLAAKDLAYNKEILTQQLVGHATGYYHPHSSDSLVTPVSHLVQVGLLRDETESNHGLSLMESIPHAAPRYTKAGLSKEVFNMLFKYDKFAPHFQNEFGKEESEFLITPVPISLLIGAGGIGIGGVVTRIPAFKLSSLIDAFRHNDPELLLPAKNTIIEADYKKLWETGTGKITYKMNIEKKYNSTLKTHFIITGDAGGIRPKFNVLGGSKDENGNFGTNTINKWIRDGYVQVQDESSDSIRLIVFRALGTRKVSDEEIEKELHKACTSTESYRIMVNVRGTAKIIGIKDWMTVTMTMFESAFSQWKNDRVAQIEDKIKEYQLLPEAGKYAQQNKQDHEIAELLGIDIEFAKRILNKPIKLLRKRDYAEDIKKAEQELLSVMNTDVESELMSIRTDVVLH